MSGTRITVSHLATCPEISPVICAETGGLPPHTHTQGITLMRLNTAVSVGLGQGWQVKTELPLAHKRLSIDYTDEAGAPYTPPYAGMHHRNENLTGVGDARLQGQYFTAWGNGLVFGGGLGSTVPLGRIEENPYARTERSLRHQHVQMGTGTFDPVASVSLNWVGARFGFLSTLDGHVPLYRNRHSYKAPASIQGSLGPLLLATPSLTLTLTADLLFETAGHWGEDDDPTSGRTAVGASGGIIYRVNPTWAVMGQGKLTAFQWSREEQITQRFVGVFGVSITPQKKDTH
jgi:hypothetical protein